jgi:hypothetical protein
VTMLFVTGSGPRWNKYSAAALPEARAEGANARKSAEKQNQIKPLRRGLGERITSVGEPGTRSVLQKCLPCVNPRTVTGFRGFT